MQSKKSGKFPEKEKVWEKGEFFLKEFPFPAPCGK